MLFFCMNQASMYWNPRITAGGFLGQNLSNIGRRLCRPGEDGHKKGSFIIRSGKIKGIWNGCSHILGIQRCLFTPILYSATAAYLKKSRWPAESIRLWNGVICFRPLNRIFPKRGFGYRQTKLMPYLKNCIRLPSWIRRKKQFIFKISNKKIRFRYSTAAASEMFRRVWKRPGIFQIIYISISMDGDRGRKVSRLSPEVYISFVKDTESQSIWQKHCHRQKKIYSCFILLMFPWLPEDRTAGSGKNILRLFNSPTDWDHPSFSG